MPRPGAFIIPIPGTPARQNCSPRSGFEALATTSLGLANTFGSLTRSSLDAKSSRTPDDRRMPPTSPSTPIWRIAARMIRRPPQKAISQRGGSGLRRRLDLGFRPGIRRPRSMIFPLAVERVQAAVEAARALPFPFTLTARAENFLHGRKDPRRHHQAAAGVRGGRRGCIVFARPVCLHVFSTVVSIPSASRSILVMGFARPDADASINSRKPASSASASAVRWRAMRLRPS